MAGVYNRKLADSFKARLSRVFHRGFSSGFYLRRPDEEIAREEGSHATVIKRYAGKVTNFYPKAGAADIQLEAGGIAVGETVVITGPTTGVVEFVAESMRSEENSPIECADSGELIGLSIPEKVRENDKVFVMSEKEESSNNS